MGEKNKSKIWDKTIDLLVPLCLGAGSTVQFHDSEVYSVFNQVKEYLSQIKWICYASIIQDASLNYAS